MAIYSGTWKDDAGLAFDPASFPIQQTLLVLSSILVAGEPTTPDCSGIYPYAGQYNGQPYFTHPDGDFYWFRSATIGHWLISATLEEEPDNYWVAANQAFGLYEEEGTVDGEPWVTWNVPPTITVTGDLTPDAANLYTFVDYYQDQPYWQDQSETYFLYSDDDAWYIRTALARRPDADYWITRESPWGQDWEPDDNYSGTPAIDPIPPPATRPHGVTRVRWFAPRGRNQSLTNERRMSRHQSAARNAFAEVTRHYIQKTEEEAMLVTGDLNPDITGWYGVAEPINGADAWDSVDVAYTIYWWPAENIWIISDEPPGKPGPLIAWWLREDPDPEGAYFPQGTAVGNAVIGYEP